MTTLNPQIITFTPPFKEAIKRIRTHVFVKEQGISEEIDFDHLDETAFQVLVSNEAGKYIATARMLKDGHIGRIAVLKPYRNLGAGSYALNALISLAKHKGYKRVFLGSQLQAKCFYSNKGFIECSDAFWEAGIKHIEMELIL